VLLTVPFGGEALLIRLPGLPRGFGDDRSGRINAVHLDPALTK
jgi:hypothetical protein